ncbi:ABC transporter ATP-binding protein [Butyrivibrio sp. AE3004]|uniref:ABC transporter ATP-binding protein n=1 Tax=Butyrivibrio sp. AE3004 TaxID=1506994 RepID=UPI0004943A38|nr:ABC transporter ATP-binding protein [Butyrivibrio sp. AE3004]
MNKAIEVLNLQKKYGDMTAVNNISFEVKQGELFAFLGENGAGKSTTINMLSTILPKTSGTAIVMGYELGKEDDLIRKEIGIVFQNSVLDDKLTVRQNLLTRGAYYGYSKKEIMERLQDFWGEFNLEEIWNRKYENLSGGQQRRVDIVRALLHKPGILFLDEPTTGLDPMSRKMVWDYINHLRRKEKLTIFLTTHYMEETADADNVVIMDKGNIIAEGSPTELKSRYTAKKLIWYTPASDRNREIIEKANVSGYRYEADHYSISMDEGMMNFIWQNKELIKDFEVIKGTMDDVFLTLTGKEMVKCNG